MVEENRLPSDTPPPPSTVPGAPPGGDHPPGGLQHPEVHYEHSDASFRGVLYVIIVALILAAIIHAAVWQLFVDTGGREAAAKESQYPLAPAESGTLPPEPRLEPLNRLEGYQKSDVYLRQQSREALLHGYGPVTGAEGYVHIPIERAMDRLAGRLPIRRDKPGKDQ